MCNPEKTFTKIVSTYAKERYSLTGDTFKALQKPVVYMVLGEDEILYVGQSQNGAGRPYAKNHHAISTITEPIKEVHLYIPDHPGDLNLLEQYLIKEFKPKYNKVHKAVDKRSYQPPASTRVM